MSLHLIKIKDLLPNNEDSTMSILSEKSSCTREIITLIINKKTLGTTLSKGRDDVIVA